MNGYFDNLLESYRPPATRVVADTPWDDPPEASASIEETPSAAATVNAPETATPDTSFLAAPEAHPDLGSPSLTIDASDDAPRTPLIAQDDWDDSGAHNSPSLAPPIESIGFDDRSAPAQGDDATTLPQPSDASSETINTFSETHIHETFQVIDNGVEAQHSPAPEYFEPEAPESDEEPSATPLSDAEARADIAALERELGAIWDRINGDDAAPVETFFRPEDFELEGGTLPAGDPTDTLREVTHEIEREVHHHHHHEAQAQAPARPAAQSAADASQIGPIQFASDWKTRGAV